MRLISYRAIWRNILSKEGRIIYKIKFWALENFAIKYVNFLYVYSLHTFIYKIIIYMISFCETLTSQFANNFLTPKYT